MWAFYHDNDAQTSLFAHLARLVRIIIKRKHDND
mgnify:FL=1